MSEQWNGVPENPERDGWHRVGGRMMSWDASEREWEIPWSEYPASPEDMADQAYEGPVYTAAEITAREAARAEAMREACASMLDTDADAAERRWAENGDRFGVGSRYVATLRRYAETLRALPIPHADALARALAAAEKRGMERAAKIADAMARERGLNAAEFPSGSHEWVGEAEARGCAFFLAAAIRNAAAQESEG